MSKNAFNRIAICTAVLLTFPVLLSADVYMKQKHHQDEFTMMGKTQPAKDYVGTMWITADKARNDMDDRSVIVLLDKNEIIVLNHAKKKYMELPLNFAETVENTAKQQGASEEDLEKLPEGMRNMMKGAMKMSATVTATNEKKVINGWNCTKYIQKIEGMMSSESEVWASQDIKIDEKLYVKFNTAMMAMMPGLKESLGDILKEMEKIKGVRVLTTTTTSIMGNPMKSSVELLEIKDNATAPAGIFEIPAGYTKGSFRQ